MTLCKLAQRGEFECFLEHVCASHVKGQLAVSAYNFVEILRSD